MRRSIRYLRKIGERILARADDYITSSLEHEFLYILTAGSVRVERCVHGFPEPIFLFRLVSAPPRSPTLAINPASYFTHPSLGNEALSMNYAAETACEIYRVAIEFLRHRIDPRHRHPFDRWAGRQIHFQNLELLHRIDQASVCNEWTILKKIRALSVAGGRVPIRINRAQIGRELGISRESVSKNVARLERAGKLTRLPGWRVLVHPWRA